MTLWRDWQPKKSGRGHNRLLCARPPSPFQSISQGRLIRLVIYPQVQTTWLLSLALFSNQKLERCVDERL